MFLLTWGPFGAPWGCGVGVLRAAFPFLSADGERGSRGAHRHLLTQTQDGPGGTSAIPQEQNVAAVNSVSKSHTRRGPRSLFTRQREGCIFYLKENVKFTI